MSICKVGFAAALIGWQLSVWQLSGAALLFAAEAVDAPQFLRVQRDDRMRPLSLETSVVRYVLPDDPGGDRRSIDLVGAVHVGERSYYTELNRMFTDYDAVLYELVAPADANVPQPGQRSAHPVGGLQRMMKTLLRLEFQLDRVEYGKPNFVHADLSPDEFRKSMADRSESFAKLFFRLWGQGLAQQSSNPGGATLFSALTAGDFSSELKRSMALQFEEVEKATLAFDGPQGSTIITERNKRALSVLDAQIKAGKKRLAIFYGAAHLPDFDRKLRLEMGYVPSATRWLVAWDLKASDD